MILMPILTPAKIPGGVAVIEIMLCAILVFQIFVWLSVYSHR